MRGAGSAAVVAALMVGGLLGSGGGAGAAVTTATVSGMVTYAHGTNPFPVRDATTMVVDQSLAPTAGPCVSNLASLGICALAATLTAGTSGSPGSYSITFRPPKNADTLQVVVSAFNQQQQVAASSAHPYTLSGPIFHATAGYSHVFKVTGVSGNINDRAFSVFDAAQLGEDWLSGVAHLAPIKIASLYPQPLTQEQAPSGGQVVLDIADQDAVWTDPVLHEFGHAVSDTLSVSPHATPGEHGPGTNYTSSGVNWPTAMLDSWAEGFADYFAVASTYELKAAGLFVPRRPDVGDTTYSFSDGASDFNLATPGTDAQGEDDEGAVARALWAISEARIGPLTVAGAADLVNALRTKSLPSFSGALTALNNAPAYDPGGSPAQAQAASDFACKVLHPNGIDPNVTTPPTLRDLVVAADGTPPSFSWFPSGPPSGTALRLDTFKAYAYDASWNMVAKEDNVTPSGSSTATQINWQPDPSSSFWKAVLAFTSGGARPTMMNLLITGEATKNMSPITGPYPSCDHQTGPVVPTLVVSGSPTPLDPLCQQTGQQSPTDNQFAVSGAGFVPGRSYNLTVAGTFNGYTLSPVGLTPPTANADSNGLLPSTTVQIPVMPGGFWVPKTKKDAHGNTVVTTPGGATATPATSQPSNQTAMKQIVTNAISCDSFIVSSTAIQTEADGVGFKPSSTVSVIWTDTTTGATANNQTVTAANDGSAATGGYTWSCTPGDSYQSSLQSSTLGGSFSGDYPGGAFTCPASKSTGSSALAVRGSSALRSPSRQ